MEIGKRILRMFSLPLGVFICVPCVIFGILWWVIKGNWWLSWLWFRLIDFSFEGEWPND